MRVLGIALALALLSFAGHNPPPTPGVQTFPLDPSKWTLTYDQGARTGRPSVLASGGWFAVYPDLSTGGLLGYATTPAKPIYGAAFMSVTLAVVATSGAPQFWGTDCGLQPVTVRLYFASGSNDGQRWWASYPTGYPDIYGFYSAISGVPNWPASATLSVPLLPQYWKSVNGEFADSSSTATANFINSMKHTSLVGVTQGGGCSYGHGVNVSNGTAQLQMTEMITR